MSLIKKTKTQTAFRPILYLLGALVLVATAYWWLKESRSIDQNWDLPGKHLPDKGALQLRIEEALYKKQSQEAPVIGPDIEQIIDPQAMEAKLAGLTKTVTLSREPNLQELEAFYLKHQENYREASQFTFKQLVFPFAKHGGLATTKARETLTDIDHLKTLEETLATIYLSSLELDNRYGQGYGDKVLGLVFDRQNKSLPCWSQPITSKLGAHIICFQQVELGDIPVLESVRSQVINDWRYWVMEKQP